MTKEPIYEGILLDESVTYTLGELCEICAIEEKLLREMAEYGIVEPVDQSSTQWAFTSISVLRSQKAVRLHQDLSINWQGVSLVLDLLDEVNELRQMIEVLKKETGSI